MLDKFVSTDKKAPDGTDFNDPPVGLRRISEKEFARSQFFTYVPRYTEYRQILVNSKEDLSKRGRGVMITLRMYWFDDDTGVAIHNDYWKGKMEYFTFGCKHDYSELSQKECHKRGISHFGNCFHVSECKKCNYVMSYDSSD